MDNSRIIKGGTSEDHLIEKFSFARLNDDKDNDIEANDMDIIVAKNNLIKEYKENFSSATKEHMVEKRKSRKISHSDIGSESVHDDMHETNPPLEKQENFNADALSTIEKNISDKIDKSLSIINNLKHSIDNIDTNGAVGDNTSEQEKQASYKQGFDDGIKQTIDNFKSDYEQDRTRLSETLRKISSYVDNSNSVLNTLENELSKASINIANEVIAKEVESDSAKVALHLAKALINDIKGAGKISLKVSPYDYDFILNNFEHPEVDIMNDMSVAKGGIIILSDVENIDGSITQRLGNIKASLES